MPQDLEPTPGPNESLSLDRAANITYNGTREIPGFGQLLRGLFSQIDSNRDGVANAADAQGQQGHPGQYFDLNIAAMDSGMLAKVREFVAHFDADHNGVLTPQEGMTMQQHMARINPQNLLQPGAAAITAEQFVNAFGEMLNQNLPNARPSGERER